MKKRILHVLPIGVFSALLAGPAATEGPRLVDRPDDQAPLAEPVGNESGPGQKGDKAAYGDAIVAPSLVAPSGYEAFKGESENAEGVVGISQNNLGILGVSTYNWAIWGESLAGGIYGMASNPGSDAIRGQNFAISGSSWGVVGTSVSPIGRGVAGFNTNGTGVAEGVYGYTASTTGRGVSGYSAAGSGTNYGVYAQNSSTNGGAGVYGDSPYVGVWGNGDNFGVYGYATNGTSNSYGVFGATVVGGYAGYFSGPVNVVGMLTKSSGSFKIDHPLDPDNKYLYHSFVESPDMMNVYNGNVTLDGSGSAWVEMPDYFEALNRDFRYQLTAVGGPAPYLHIAERLDGKRFQISGGTPGLEVSWQVTGIRQDAYANANRIVVEVDKPEDERGTLLHPEAWGVDRSMGLDYQRERALGNAGSEASNVTSVGGKQ